ncbi:MFS transporter [Streptomyces sp. DSM 42041]|uniref:MFS transporter n=1 Tax=Streptomyces hazeniae TaxID=3075538 RepID=A0ABU2NW67_9ACTN|nr:MFS transporter [Streptomyces sp. DSM 42041]MDT0380950.1 MFS transporter [Streptomyces sp. DSM 42041]
MSLRVYLLFQTFVERFLLFAIPLMVYRATGSVQSSGVSFLVEWLPTIMMLPLTGIVVDRYGVRNVFLGSNAIRLAVCFLFFGILMGSESAAAYIIVGGILSLFNLFAYVAFEKHITVLKSKDEVAKAFSFFQFNQQSMQVIVPICGAWIVVHVAPHLLFLISAVSYLLLLLLARAMPHDEHRSQVSVGNTFKAIKDAFRFVGTSVTLRWLGILMMSTNFAFGLMYTALPDLVLHIEGQSEVYLGSVYGLAALVSFVYFLSSSKIAEKELVEPLGVAAALIIPASPLLLAFSTGVPVLALSFCLVAGPLVAFSVHARVVRNAAMPSENYALTISITMILSLLGLPLSGAYIAVATSHLSVPTAIICASVVALLLSVVSLRAMRPSYSHA